MPRPADSAPWGSRSTTRTRRPYSASAAARLMVLVVLPTPPFWLHIATTVAGPWEVSGRGAGSASDPPAAAGTSAPSTPARANRAGAIGPAATVGSAAG